MMVGVKAFLGQYISPDKKLITSIKNITGFFPHNLRIYKIALTHKTASAEIKEGVYDSNERLEFLGDAILGGVIADFLYKCNGFTTMEVSPSSKNHLYPEAPTDPFEN